MACGMSCGYDLCHGIGLTVIFTVGVLDAMLRNSAQADDAIILF